MKRILLKCWKNRSSASQNPAPRVLYIILWCYIPFAETELTLYTVYTRMFLLLPVLIIFCPYLSLILIHNFSSTWFTVEVFLSTIEQNKNLLLKHFFKFRRLLIKYDVILWCKNLFEKWNGMTWNDIFICFKHGYKWRCHNDKVHTYMICPQRAILKIKKKLNWVISNNSESPITA